MWNILRKLFGREQEPVDPSRDLERIAAPLFRTALHVVRSDALTKSQIGGDPCLPAGVAWPQRDGAKLRFLARVSLTELQSAEATAWLPQSGALLFFYDDDKLPCAIVSPYLMRPNNAGGTNRETAVDFQVMLSFHWAGGREAINGMGDALAGMTEALRLFSKKPNSWLGFTVDAGESCLKDATIDNAEALNLEAWRAGVTAQYLIINYSLRLGYAGVN